MRKVLQGLRRGGGGDGDGYGLSGHDNDRHGGVSKSSCSGDSSLEDAEDASGYKPGGRAGGAPRAEGAAATAEEGPGADPEEDEEDGEDGDKFEVDGPPNSPHLAGSTLRAGQGLGPPRGASDGGRGGASAVIFDGEAVAPRTNSAAAAIPTIPTAAAQGKAGARAATREAAAVGMPEVPDRFRAGVEFRLGETCDAFQTSIRRAVLNYVLLDPGQRNRLGTR